MRLANPSNSLQIYFCGFATREKEREREREREGERELKGVRGLHAKSIWIIPWLSLYAKMTFLFILIFPPFFINPMTYSLK